MKIRHFLTAILTALVAAFAALYASGVQSIGNFNDMMRHRQNVANAKQKDASYAFPKKRRGTANVGVYGPLGQYVSAGSDGGVAEYSRGEIIISDAAGERFYTMKDGVDAIGKRGTALAQHSPLRPDGSYGDAQSPLLVFAFEMLKLGKAQPLADGAQAVFLPSGGLVVFFQNGDYIMYAANGERIATQTASMGSSQGRKIYGDAGKNLLADPKDLPSFVLEGGLSMTYLASGALVVPALIGGYVAYYPNGAIALTANDGATANFRPADMLNAPNAVWVEIKYAESEPRWVEVETQIPGFNGMERKSDVVEDNSDFDGFDSNFETESDTGADIVPLIKAK